MQALSKNYLTLKARNRLEVISAFWPGATVLGKANEYQVSTLYINDAAPFADETFSFRDKLGAGGVPVRYVVLTGDPVADQANMDKWINEYADGGVTCLAFDWYQ